MAFRRTPALVLLAVAAFGSSGAMLYRRQRQNPTTYPLLGRAPHGVASALWSMDAATLDRTTADDVRRLTESVSSLDRAVEHLRSLGAVIDNPHPEALPMEDRQRLRDAWADVLDPLLALDALKHRYEGWYGIDYLSHPALHARAFAIELTALCAQAAAGHAVAERVNAHPSAQHIIDERVVERGIPSGTFTAVRAQLTRTRDFSYVPVGAQWFDVWIARQLRAPGDQPLRALVNARRAQAVAALGARDAVTTAENRLQTLQQQAFQRWFPVQTEVATWAGDTRVAPENRRLVSNAQLDAMREQMHPGDVIVERRNWYISNIGLPGFWPHAIFYSGSQDEIRATFDALPEVTAVYGMPFSQYLAQHRAVVWNQLGTPDANGHVRRVLEAVSEGVVTNSLEHACGGDYVAVMRPTFGPVMAARAIDRAFGLQGRPYDFNFDFATDDQIVCSELVLKAYEPASATAPGLRVPPITVAGHSAIPPTELVRTFAAEQSAASPQLTFVYFLDGRERTHAAVVSDAAALRGTLTRPKWDIAQP